MYSISSSLRKPASNATYLSADKRNGYYYYSIVINHYLNEGKMPGPVINGTHKFVKYVSLYIQTSYIKCTPSLKRTNSLSKCSIILLLLS